VKPTGDRFRFEGLPVGQVFLAGLAPPAPFGRRCIFDAGDDEAERRRHLEHRRMAEIERVRLAVLAAGRERCEVRHLAHRRTLRKRRGERRLDRDEIVVDRDDGPFGPVGRAAELEEPPRSKAFGGVDLQLGGTRPGTAREETQDRRDARQPSVDDARRGQEDPVGLEVDGAHRDDRAGS